MRTRSCATVVVLFGLLSGAFAAAGAAAQTPASAAPWTTDQAITGGAIPCDKGKIKIMSCSNVELLAYLPPAAMGGVGEYDIWGWTDSTTGREFAIVGGGDGTSFVEVTDPVNPKYLGKLGFHEDAQGLAGVKVYKNYAFIVVEGSTAGLQVFDLTQLRDVKNAPATFKETAHYGEFGNAHTITMNPETGFAYPTGLGGSGETCNGALYMIDVRTPTKPSFAGCYSDPGYIHDAMCIIYRGPDTRYQGREICFASGIPLGAVDIVDVTDKKNPKRIGKAEVPNAQIVHQGWFTEDQRYFFLDDEGDPTDRTRTIVFDMAKLDDPVVLLEFFNPNSDATSHNLYIRGKYMYQSNYTAGLRIVDVSDPKNPKEVGYLDTDPDQDGPGQRLGTWGNYPYFKDNVVAVASNGLFLVRLKQ
jgi:choice-of-anchor B domain-containing protein